jgi:hypothetical protein
MFQPTHYEVVTGDRLQEWEYDLAEKVGLRGLKLANTELFSRSYSSCPGKGGGLFSDDCDMLEA